MAKRSFQGVAEVLADKNNPAVADIAHNSARSSSKYNNGLVFAVLKALNALGLSRFSSSSYIPNAFSKAAKKPELAPRPGKNNGF